MVSALAGGKALPAALLEQILTRTDGVPLFVEELTKSILESGELKEAGDHYEYAGPARAVTIPATLRDSLMARLDRFMPVKEIAQIGAAIGREFSYELIAAVAPISQAQLDDSLARLCKSGLAFRRGTPPDAVYTFKHALVQDAAYQLVAQEPPTGIARQDRTRRSSSASRTSRPPNPRCWRITSRKRALVEAAIPLWQTAGELALKRTALTEAISHLNQGARTGLHPASVVATRRQRTGAAHPPWHRVGGAQRLGHARSLDQPASGTCLGEVARALRRAGAHPLRTNNERPGARARSRVPAVGAGDAGRSRRRPAIPTCLITGHGLCRPCYCWAGEFTKAVEHSDEVLASLRRSRSIITWRTLLNHDPKTSAGFVARLAPGCWATRTGHCG